MAISGSFQPSLIKFIVLIILSPLIGYIALEIVLNIEKAKKLQGRKKWVSLAIAGFLIAILLGWIQ